MQTPAGYAPLFVETVPDPIGALAPPAAAALAGVVASRGDGFALPSPEAGALQEALDRAFARLIAAGLAPPPRTEAIAVCAGRDGPALARVDRAAAEPLGLLVTKVCLVAVVEGPEPAIWLARRSLDRRTAPGLLDTTVAGGVAAGATPEETLAEEAREEAGLEAAGLARARRVARLDRVAPTPEGLAREDLIVWELVVEQDFSPRPRDEEIAGFELWTLAALAEALVAPVDFKPGAAIVLRDVSARRAGGGSA